MWDASRSDPGALSERQRRPQQVLPERCSSVIPEALAARASAQKQTDDSHLIGSLMQWLNDHRQLFVRPLVFEETLVADFKSIPRAEDINNGFNMGLRWRQKPNGNYELTRLKGGRVIVANFDPMALTDQQRFELNERSRRTRADSSIWIFSRMDRVAISSSRGRSSCGACFRSSTLSPQAFARHQSSTSVRTHGPERWTSGRLRR